LDLKLTFYLDVRLLIQEEATKVAIKILEGTSILWSINHVKLINYVSFSCKLLLV